MIKRDKGEKLIEVNSINEIIEVILSLDENSALIYELNTVEDYLYAVEISVRSVLGKINPQNKDDDYGGVASLMINSLLNCEALYATSRRFKEGEKIPINPESFYLGEDYIFSSHSAYTKNSNRKSNVLFIANDSIYLHLMMLYCYSGLTGKIRRMFDEPEHLKVWPHNPNAKVFTASGLSYLEALFNFTKENALKISSTIAEPDMKGKVKEVPVVPNPPFVKVWKERVLRYMRRNIPEKEVSNTAMRAEFNSVRSQLEHEFNLFCGKRWTSPYSSESEGHDSEVKPDFEFLTGQVLYNGHDLNISGLKIDVLKEFHENCGRVVTREKLVGITPKAFHYIGELRHLLEEQSIPYSIVTVQKEGYKMERS